MKAILFYFLFTTTFGLYANILLVNPSATSAGTPLASVTATNWTASAYNKLSLALAAANNGDEIWIKAGVYKPDRDSTGNLSPANTRTKTFYITQNVKLYGGFAGTETAVSQRSGAATILSGDLSGNDSTNYMSIANLTSAANRQDNVYHIMIRPNNSISGTVLLDGIDIKGAANYGFYEKADNGKLVINACNFTYHAQGGLRTDMSSSIDSLLVSNATFYKNSAGLGLNIWGYNSDIKIDACDFSGNINGITAIDIANLNHFTIDNTYFSGNINGIGFDVLSYISGSMHLNNCYLGNNDNGLYYSAGNNTATNYLNLYIDNCTLSDNNSDLYSNGYELFNLDISNSTSSHSTNNVATGIYIGALVGNVSIDNCDFSTGMIGLMLYIGGNGNVDIRDSHFSGYSGEAISFFNEGTLSLNHTTIDNCNYGVYIDAYYPSPVSIDSSSFNQNTCDIYIYSEANASISHTAFLGTGNGNYAIFTNGGNVTLQSNQISNYVYGIFNEYAWPPCNYTIDDCVFTNLTDGFYNPDVSGWLNITHSKFQSCGTGMTFMGTWNASFCEFTNNGIGIYGVEYMSGGLSDSYIANNTTGISHYGQHLDINRSIIYGNGTGISSTSYQPGTYMNIKNTLIANNTYAGISRQELYLNLTNCTIVNNGADGINQSSSTNQNGFPCEGEVTVYNSIFYGNTGWDIHSITDSVHTSHSLIASNKVSAPISYGAGMLNGNPNFQNPTNPDGVDNIWNTYDDGYRIPCSSIAANVGNNTKVIGTTDLTRTNRIKNTTVDLGAYEAGLNITVNAANTNICVGGTVLLSGTVLGTTGTKTYQWEYSTNNTSFTNITTSGTAINYTVPSTTLAGTHYYRLKVSDTGTGCVDYSPSIQITVSPDPTITVSGASAFCGNGTATLSASTTGGAGNCTIQWQTYTTTWSNIAGANNTFYPTPNLTASKSYRAYISCTGSGCGIAYSNTAVITINSLPTITPNPTTFTICTGGSKSIAVSGASTYSWSPSTGLNTTTGSSVVANPSTTTTYTVTGTNTTTGCVNTNTSTITVIPDPSVSITGSTSACSGTSVNLTAASTGGTGTCTLQWQSSVNGTTWTNITGATGNSYTTPALTATTNYYRVSMACTGSGCNTASSNILQIMVSPKPILTLSGNSPICTGGVAQLSVTLLGGTGSCPYTWQYSTNGTTWILLSGVTTNTYISGVLTANRSYRVITNCTGLGCGGDTSNVYDIMVNPDPSISASGAATFCGSGSSTLTMTTLGGAGSPIYQWQEYVSATWTNIAGATSATYQTPVLTASKTFRATYTTSANGCGTANSSNVVVTINPLPNLTTSPVNSATICQGGSLNMSVSGANIYSWSPALGLNFTTGNLVTASPTTTTIYTVTGTNSTTGCINSKNITVNVVPDPTISINTTQATTICSGGSITLNATLTGGTGTCNIVWQSSTNGTTWTTISGATSSSYTTPTLTSIRYYRATYTCNGFGCGGSAISNILTITVNPDPVVSISSSTNSVCAGASVTLNSSSTGGANNCFIQWQRSSNGTTWNNIANAINTTYTFTAAFFYQYRIKRYCNGLGCDTAYSNIITITVNPNTSITLNGPSAVLSGSSATLNAVGNGGTGTCSYIWEESANGSNWSIISGANNATYTTLPLTNSTFYRVSYTCTGQGCFTAMSNTLFIAVGSASKSLQIESSPNKTNHDIAIFPNPTDGEISVVLSDEIFEDALIQIENVLGQTIVQKTLNSNEKVYSFTLEGFPKGMYFIKLKIKGNETSYKVILQ